MEETVAPSPWPLLRRSVRRHWRRLVPGYVLLALWQLCETLVPVAIGIVVDRGIDSGSTGRFVTSLLVLVALMTTLAFSYRFGSRLIVRGLEEESHLLRTEVAGHVLHPRGARTDQLPGEVLALATGDADRVGEVVYLLGYTISALLSVAIVAVYVLQVDVVIGLLILLGVPIVTLVIQAVTPLVAQRSERQQESIASASGLATDLVHGLRPLKGIGGEDVAFGRYRSLSRTAQHDTISVARSWGYLGGLTTLLSGLLLASVALVAGRRALDGDLTLGELIALVGLTQFLAEPISQLGDVSAKFGGAFGSARRLSAFLASPRLQPSADGTLAAMTSAPRLVLADVHRGPLAGLSLSVEPDEILALVIDDPAVADTLMTLLHAEATPGRGVVSLGGVPLTDLDVDERRHHLLVSPHSAQVPAGTIASTVNPGQRLDDEQLGRVLVAAAADEVVALHPEGLDRVISERGTSLSGGQRQRLALARALATAAPVLVLHDPTTAIDSVTEQGIADGLRDLRRGRATLVLTSSPALLNAADRVVVVHGGRVVLSGSHAELLEDAGYREDVLR